ncbi:TonB-dependent siderophore receptor [Brevundimonas sp. NIBR11]|uniref:TonB-dependent receptor n=1 Tax=Brevundimonas sp. NIBR11 TaxID=3015999 RepID=UPI0022F11488|nr:TonB-dependent siderophore receptor [Brevundimonas sp. NIBR11]WGM30072.1 Ferrichrome receptor FcuA [Brevundimonas sp. NIBR11]
MVRTLVLSTTVFFVIAAVAQAQTQQEADQLDEVVVTGSQVRISAPYAGGQVARGARVGLFGTLGQLDTPFAVTAYTEDLARNQQARSVADVLQNDPAVRVSKGFGNFQELYILRGFPIYSDDMTYNGLYGILPRQFVASEFLERVEVFHGATAFLNGAAPGGSAIGGSINLTPKRAGDVPLTRATVGLEGGGESYVAADVARRFGADAEYGVRFNVARRDGEGAVDDQSRTLNVVGLGLDRRGDRARFSADLGWQDQRIDAPRPTVTPTGAVPAAPDASSNFAQPWTYTDEEQLFGVARGEFDLTDSVAAWAALGAREGEENNRLANPTAQPNGVTSAYRFDNHRKDSVWSGDIGVRAELATGPVNHRIVASASMVRSREKNAYAFSNFAGFASDLYNPVTVAPPVPNFFVGGDLSSPREVGAVDYGSLALADMLGFMDGRLLVTLGARYQEIETKAFDYNTGALLTEYQSDAITPAFAVVYKVIPEISLYANYAEALIPGQTAPLNTPGGVQITNPGEVLEPYVGEQVEVGMKYDVGRFGGSVSLFRTTQQSAFIENNRFGANGEQRNQGLEIAFFGEPREGLRLLGGWTVLEAELTRTATAALQGKTPIGAPEIQGNVNVEWDVPQLSGLTLEGRAVYTGEQEVDALNTVQLESWTRFDAGVRYAFTVGGRDLTARARVENIADENQWVAVGGYPGANYLTLGAPRTLSVSVSTAF